MTGAEWGVVLVGLVCGYWLVSLWSGRSIPPQAKSHTGADEAQSATAPPVQEPAWHTVLEVDPQATEYAIKTACRRQMSLYHPDKVAALGPELRELAEKKAQQIEAAYRAGVAACTPMP